MNDDPARPAATAAAYLVTLSGEVDMARGAELRASSHAFAATAEPNVLVDLGEVTFLDSTGLTLLVSLLRIAQERGGALTVKAPGPAVRRVLDIVAFDKIMTIVD